mmetsp:Transcript_9939/g.26450  ORF Transcript_9939/g.26450 Transcript_9939/m.26450 type:complete len:224 (+) Transcript_9939:2636-3307(+)
MQLLRRARHDGAHDKHFVCVWCALRIQQLSLATLRLQNPLKHGGVVIRSRKKELWRVAGLFVENFSDQATVQRLNLLDGFVLDAERGRNDSARARPANHVKHLVDFVTRNSLQVLQHLKRHHRSGSAAIDTEHSQPALSCDARFPRIDTQNSQQTSRSASSGDLPLPSNIMCCDMRVQLGLRRVCVLASAPKCLQHIDELRVRGKLFSSFARGGIRVKGKQCE